MSELTCLFCGGAISVGSVLRVMDCDRCKARWAADGSLARQPAGSSWWHGGQNPGNDDHEPVSDEEIVRLFGPGRGMTGGTLP